MSRGDVYLTRTSLILRGDFGVWSRKADVAEGGSLHARRGRADTQASQDWDAKVGLGCLALS